MSVLTEINTLGDWLLYEEHPPSLCREEGTLASGQNLVSGTVLSLGSGGTWSAFIDDDGTFGTAEGILIHSVDATSGALPCVVLVRGPAIVSKSGLTWHADNDATEEGIGLAALLALGIVAREGV